MTVIRENSMNSDAKKLLREIDMSLPVSIVPELMARIVVLESRVAVMWELFAQISAAALHKEHEECEDKQTILYNEESNRRIAELLARFGKLRESRGDEHAAGV
jgi:hypothetical protein